MKGIVYLVQPLEHLSIKKKEKDRESETEMHDIYGICASKMVAPSPVKCSLFKIIGIRKVIVFLQNRGREEPAT